MSPVHLQPHCRDAGQIANQPWRELHLIRRISRTCSDLVSAALWTVETWAGKSQQRRQLGRLSERELRDIGLSRYDAEMELRKPFWR